VAGVAHEPLLGTTVPAMATCRRRGSGFLRAHPNDLGPGRGRL